jgi:hypothetical protein
MDDGRQSLGTKSKGPSLANAGIPNGRVHLRTSGDESFSLASKLFDRAQPRYGQGRTSHLARRLIREVADDAPARSNRSLGDH